MLSFEDLIKHLCHDCDVREIFSFASPVPPILFVPFIVAFRLRFTSTRRLDGLSLPLSPSVLPFCSVCQVFFFFAITSGFGSIQFPLLSSLARIPSGSLPLPLPVSFETVIMTWANVLYLSDVYIRVCTNIR